MRLTTIKLAGFKSFVDPTVLHLPTNLSAVVGPNGCGKSNIIDAIRWVMGESAASRLRGDALTDVIFSGSSTRKPVGSAIVELIFDNADGTVTGECAGYAEISVKRLVSRDGQSQYFLNGTRCRRRDVTDLFLGTGLGPRSYSIIEQGTISRIIESDPEQLRSHLEEAAGISRYKERRKETESRIKATRENLDRVCDVRDEVDKQLEHLNRQARAAERWQKLKETHKQTEAELRALTLRGARRELESHAAALRQADLGIEEQLAEQRQREALLETGREAHAEASEQHNAVQGEVYKVGAEVARIEQQIQHSRHLADQLGRAAEEAARAHAELSAHIATDHEQIDSLTAILAEAEPKLANLRGSDQHTAHSLREAEAALSDWQGQWNTYAQAASESSQAAEVERTRLDYLDRQCVEADKRRDALLGEQQAADLGELGRSVERLNDEHGALIEQVETLAATLDEHRGMFEQHVEQERTIQGALSIKRGQLESARGRLGSLEALQHAALAEPGAAASQWLERAGLGSAQRLAEVITVEAGWERAIETALDGWLEAVLVDDPARLSETLAGLRDADLGLIDPSRSDAQHPTGTLAAQVRGPAVVTGLLAPIRSAATLEQARQMVPTLARGESVMTPEGEWLGRGFVRVQRGQGAQVGVLAREREIQTLQATIAELEREVDEHAEALDDGKRARIDVERLRDEAQREVYTAQRRLAETAGQVLSHQGRLDSASERLARVGVELSELTEKLDADREQVRDARGRLEIAVTAMGQLEQQRQELDGARRRLLEAREEARMSAQEAADQAHQLALSIESRRSALASLEQSIGRMQGQLAQLDARKAEIAAQLASADDPLAELEAQRQTALNQRLLVDKDLVEARKRVEEHDAQLRQLEQERHRIEQILVEKRDAFAELRLREQEHRLRAQTLADAIVEAGFEIETILAAVPDDADAAQWHENLVSLEQKIHRLEPVNLAAIQEYEEQAQRKNYLDAQLTDLNTALETLEGAISKIDKETRQRFKETFDRVNAGVQELFPRLFGGGHAYLELTGDDLLSTGVSILARPPGKRVSSITLLSGGEKAMTAVALVFAIFRLNPAPFCLLDEVDAPLDEANVGRFTAMVTEMSEQVQFIFVTHNKSTMEAATQLCGVTMREPGVSRLVQVDLAEAAKLAGAA